jgi:hypothetical protein
VLVNIRSSGCEPVSWFEVSKGPEEEDFDAGVAVSRQISDKHLSYEEASGAVYGGGITQHNLHSELTDKRVISQTIGFDAEEVVATDISTLALSYTINGSGPGGSDITVYTMDREQGEKMLSAFQSAGIDPVALEPDSICLGRFLKDKFHDHRNIIFAICTKENCYLISSLNSKFAPTVRSFLIDESMDFEGFLTREILLMSASEGNDNPVEGICIAGVTGLLDKDKLSERTGFEVISADLSKALRCDSAEEELAVDYAIAYGSAMAESVRDQRVDFRESFAPYEGKKKLLSKMFTVISIAVTVMALAVGGYFQVETWRNWRYTSRLDKKMNQQYSDIMYGKKHTSAEPIYSKLQRVYRQLEKVKKGLISGDDESVSARMTFLLEVINNLPSNVDVEIEEISISERNMSLRGTTNSRAATLQLFRQIDQHASLKRSNEILKQSGGRDSFNVNLQLK